jgi:disulfide bond formation protein DsbB
MKMMFRLFVLLLVGMLALSACGGGESETDEPTTEEENGEEPEEGAVAGDAAAGETLFAGTCVSCHGVDAKGLPGLGKDMTTSEFIASQTDQQLIDFIKVGRPTGDPANTTGVDMPPKGGNPALDDQDIADIVAYIRTLNNP